MEFTVEQEQQKIILKRYDEILCSKANKQSLQDLQTQLQDAIQIVQNSVDQEKEKRGDFDKKHSEFTKNNEVFK